MRVWETSSSAGSNSKTLARTGGAFYPTHTCTLFHSHLACIFLSFLTETQHEEEGSPPLRRPQESSSYSTFEREGRKASESLSRT